MPETEENPGSQISLPIRLRGNDLLHQGEQGFRVVLGLDIHVKLNMFVLGLLGNMVSEQRLKAAATYQHKERDGLGECWNGLDGLLDGANMLHPLRSIPVTLLDQA